MSGESLTTVNANEITKNAATNNTKVDTNLTHLIRRPSEYFNFQRKFFTCQMKSGLVDVGNKLVGDKSCYNKIRHQYLESAKRLNHQKTLD